MPPALLARLGHRLATGAWLDRPAALRIACLTLAGTAAAVTYLVLTGSGTLDAWGRPLGTDFSNVWTAGAMAIEGRAVEVYDWAQHYRVQQATHGSDAVPFYGWHYPPPFLLLAAALATLPYLPALLVWQAATLAAALAVVWRILPGRDTLVVALGCPVVLVCLTHGHNGFLTAALFGGGLLLVDRRPLVAGLCFGLLSYKPQFGLVLPLALAAGGYWRTIASAAATVLALAAVTTLAFGADVWVAFLGSTGLTRTIVLEAGGTGWHKIQSAFSAARMWGAPVDVAYAAQGAVTFATVAASAWVWRLGAALPLRAASLLVGALLATPYVLDYDMALLGPAIAFLAAQGQRQGFWPWEKTLLAIAWFAPLGGRPIAAWAAVPVGFLTMATLFGLIIARAAAEARASRLAEVSPPPDQALARG